jgi:hypothetical protein
MSGFNMDRDIKGLLDGIIRETAALFTLHILPLHPRFDDLQSLLLRFLPIIWNHTYYVLDAIFSPEQLLRHLFLGACLQTSVFGIQRFGGLIRYLLMYSFSKGRKMLALNKQLRSALTFEDWRNLAQRLDELQSMPISD